MGVCSSTDISRRGGGVGGGAMVNWSTTAKVIHSTDGRLEEFSNPIKADSIISLYPNTFLCNSETMYINANVADVPSDEDLHLGQIYFLMPRSKLHTPLSLQELCSLAIKASAALDIYNATGFPPRAPANKDARCCTIPTGFEAVGFNFGHLRTNS